MPLAKVVVGTIVASNIKASTIHIFMLFSLSSLSFRFLPCISKSHNEEGFLCCHTCSTDHRSDVLSRASSPG